MYDECCVGLDIGGQGCTDQSCEGANVFWSLDDFEVFPSELLQRHSSFTYIEEANVVGSYNEIDWCSGVAVLNVDRVGRRYEIEGFIVDMESHGQVWMVFDGAQNDSQGSAIVRKLPGCSRIGLGVEQSPETGQLPEQ